MTECKNIRRTKYVHYAVLTAIYAAVVLLLTHFKYAYGSELDWASQHYAIPDYFRKLFYETGDLFPSFAAHIGGGENIYNLSYYGLYSPIILFSYLLPFVKMSVYIQAVSLIGMWSGILLFYRFMSTKFNRETSFVLSLIYMSASPLIFHSHRHIMFVNYLPFLILALGAVDNYFEKNKKAGLILWTLMIILCSYFFSVSAIIVIVIYGVYRYIELNERFTAKEFFKAGLCFAGRLFTAVLLSGVLILPTLAALLKGRDTSNVAIDFTRFLPSVKLGFMNFSTYAMGISCFGLLSIVSAVLCRSAHRRFLGISCGLTITFPLLVYVLNGTLYFDSKVLIPFIPLVIMLIGFAYTELCERSRSYKLTYMITVAVFVIGIILYDGRISAFWFMIADFAMLTVFLVLFNLKAKKMLLWIPMITVSFVSMLFLNHNEHFITLKDLSYENSENFETLADVISQDDDLVRSSTSVKRRDTVNMIYSMDFYSPYIYSSLHNRAYNNFYFKDIKNENEFRNLAMTTRSSNILFDIFMGNKYLITDGETAQTGYQEVMQSGGLYLYRNEYAMPVGRSSSSLISAEDYQMLNNAKRMEALVKCVVVDGDVSNGYTSTVEPYHTIELPTDERITKTSGGYRINSAENFKITALLPQKVPSDKIFFFQMNADNKTGKHDDVKITVNGTKNTLTNPEWKYYNQNTVFEYVLTSENSEFLTSLEIEFGKGDYTIGELQAFTMDYPEAADADKLEVDKSRTKGDVIAGRINCSEDGYFELTVPYNDGFEITVDGEPQRYECVDKAFIGFPIKAGEHEIVIKFTAPLLHEGIAMSLAGLLICAVMFTAERLKKQPIDK